MHTTSGKQLQARESGVVPKRLLRCGSCKRVACEPSASRAEHRPAHPPVGHFQPPPVNRKFYPPPCLPKPPFLQLAALSRLQRLKLTHTSYSAQQCGTLPSLPALTELELVEDIAQTWEWCLHHCTRLRRVSLRHCQPFLSHDEPAEGAAARRAQQELPSLTWLECSHTSRYFGLDECGGLPSLPALRELVWREPCPPPLAALGTALTRLQLSAASAERGAAEVQAARAANPKLAVVVLDEEASRLPPGQVHCCGQLCCSACRLPMPLTASLAGPPTGHSCPVTPLPL